MARKTKQLTYVKALVLSCVCFAILNLSYLYCLGLGISELLTLSCLFIFFISFIARTYNKISRKTKADLEVLNRFLTSSADLFEVDLRDMSLREFEDLAISINSFSEKRASRLDELNTANDTLSISINQSDKQLLEVNEKLTSEIVEHKKTEQSLERALETAEMANKAKSEFLSNMRHEIRTPMNAIIGMTDLVLDSDISDKQKGLLTVVRESGESLLKIINDILDLAKLDTGEMVLSHEMFVLEDTLEVTARNFEDAINAKGLKFKSTIEDDVPGMVNGDYNRLTKVLYSLVDNAVKFTDEGSITITVKNKSIDDSKLILHFIVKDTGIGIDQDKRDAIFIPFSQIDGSYTRQFEGTGLGLTIEKMGGIMWIDDYDGTQGSSFNFIVHLEKAVLPGME